MKKNSNNMLWFLGGAAILGVGYFVYNRFSKRGESKAKEIRQQGALSPSDISTPVPVLPSISPSAPPTAGNPFAKISDTISSLLTSFQTYQISTNASSLNVRSQPNAQAKVVGSLKKGSQVRAKASGVAGWFAISDNDSDIKGYVSSLYLKK